MTKTQIDRLGDRLRRGRITEADLRLLDLYRHSFAEAYEAVVGSIRQRSGLDPTGRPAKSTTSILEKLRRESIRLTQMQDIAGCRLIVPDIANQERIIEVLSHLFDDVAIVDRREHPSYGYRAVHLIVTVYGKMIEIQVRTWLQDLWAELSEKLSDVVDPTIKYGGGEERIRELLAEVSDLIDGRESTEKKFRDLLPTGVERAELPEDVQELVAIKAAAISEGLESFKQQIVELFALINAWIEGGMEGG